MSEKTTKTPSESTDSSGVDPFEELSDDERGALIEVRDLAAEGNHRDAREKLSVFLGDPSYSEASKIIASSLRRDLGPDRVAQVVAGIAIFVVTVVFVMVTGT